MSLNSARQGEAGQAMSGPGRRRSPEPPGAPSVQGRAPQGARGAASGAGRRARRYKVGRPRRPLALSRTAGLQSGGRVPGQ